MGTHTRRNLLTNKDETIISFTNQLLSSSSIQDASIQDRSSQHRLRLSFLVVRSHYRLYE